MSGGGDTHPEGAALGRGDNCLWVSPAVPLLPWVRAEQVQGCGARGKGETTTVGPPPTLSLSPQVGGGNGGPVGPPWGCGCCWGRPWWRGGCCWGHCWDGVSGAGRDGGMWGGMWGEGT